MEVLSGILLTFLILIAIIDIKNNSLCEAETKESPLHVADSHAAYSAHACS